ncbi:MAG: hypothetical protein ABIJ21_08335 [Nanoarchaeota archaeon]
MSLGRVGVIGRWKPLHNGAAAMLESICSQAEHVLVGIGSSNTNGTVQKYNRRNPFTPRETKDMIDLLLQPRFTNYETLFIPDYGHQPECRDGQKWREHVVSAYGSLDHFITSNPYVATLLKDDYDIIHPGTIVPRSLWTRLRATEVRIAMAKGEGWRELVPGPVAAYLKTNHLVKRFREEFGLETIMLLGTDYSREESPHEEKLHTYEK